MARYVFSQRAQVLVMPDDTRGPSVDHVRTEFPSFFDDEEHNDFNGVIFYLSSLNFAELHLELSSRAEKTVSVWDAEPLSELKGTLVYDFVVNSVLKYIEDNLGGDKPDYLYYLAQSEGLIPIANLESEAVPTGIPLPPGPKTKREWQDAIMKYENRLAEFIRLAGRTRDADFLREFETKVKIARTNFLAAMQDDPDGQKAKWLEQYFSDVATEAEEVKKLFAELGFEW
jgi:hypothetical protein